MLILMKISKVIDWINNVVGKLAMWMVLAATLISAGNALMRYTFNYSSNAYLEIQWYLFGAVFLLGGGYAFLRNAHVRIDVLSSRLTDRARNWIDIAGIVLFLFPMCYMLASMGWPLFERAWTSGEMSSSAGGLIRWPAFALIPAGFTLLALQGVSEIIKRLNFLFANGPDSLSYSGTSDAELLAKVIADQEKAALKRSREGKTS